MSCLFIFEGIVCVCFFCHVFGSLSHTTVMFFIWGVCYGVCLDGVTCILSVMYYTTQWRTKTKLVSPPPSLPKLLSILPWSNNPLWKSTQIPSSAWWYDLRLWRSMRNMLPIIPNSVVWARWGALINQFCFGVDWRLSLWFILSDDSISSVSDIRDGIALVSWVWGGECVILNRISCSCPCTPQLAPHSQK